MELTGQFPRCGAGRNDRLPKGNRTGGKIRTNCWSNITTNEFISPKEDGNHIEKAKTDEIDSQR